MGTDRAAGSLSHALRMTRRLTNRHGTMNRSEDVSAAPALFCHRRPDLGETTSR
jgi:hypothetical protein